MNTKQANSESENSWEDTMQAELDERQKLESFSRGGVEWDRAWNTAAETNAKFGAIVWVIYGVYAIFFARKFEGSLLSFFIFFPLYFFVGSGLAALSAIIPCTPMYLLNRLSNKYRNIVLGILTIIVTKLTWILVIIWIIFIANWFIMFLNNLFN